MSSPENPINGRSENTYGMAIQPGALTGTRTAPSTPDKPRVKAQEEDGKKRFITGARVALALGLAATETAGVAIDQQIDQQPASVSNIARESVTWPWDLGKTAAEDISRVFRKEPNIPIVIDPFPNKLDVSYFTPATSEEAVTQLQETIDNGTTIDTVNLKATLLLPLDAETLASNPDIKFAKKNISILPNDVPNKEELSKVTNSWQAEGIPDGTVVYAPIGGAKFSGYNVIAGHTYGEGSNAWTPSYSTIRIDGVDGNGKKYGASIAVLGGIPLSDFEDGQEIQAGQPLFIKDSTRSVGGTSSIAKEKGDVSILIFSELRYETQNSKVDGLSRSPVPLDVNFLPLAIQGNNG